MSHLTEFRHWLAVMSFADLKSLFLSQGVFWFAEYALIFGIAHLVYLTVRGRFSRILCKVLWHDFEITHRPNGVAWSDIPLRHCRAVCRRCKEVFDDRPAARAPSPPPAPTPSEDPAPAPRARAAPTRSTTPAPRKPRKKKTEAAAPLPTYDRFSRIGDEDDNFTFEVSPDQTPVIPEDTNTRISRSKP